MTGHGRALQRLFLDGRSKVRNGWWILVFVAFVALTRVVHGPTMELLEQLGVDTAWREPVPVIFILLATWAALRLRRERLASVGLGMDRRWVREFGAGGALGIAMLLAVAGLMAAAGVLRFELEPTRSLSALALGLNACLWAAMLEELLFRGFIFQRLLHGIGHWPAQLGVAGLFAAGHWSNPGMEGVARFIGTVDIALAAIMLGLAYVRTRSLALPLGLHLGWNWMQGSVLGFNVSGYDHAGWWSPAMDAGSVWLTGGGVGPEGSIFSVGMCAVVIVGLWRWKGTARMPDDRPVAPDPAGIGDSGSRPSLAQA